MWSRGLPLRAFEGAPIAQIAHVLMVQSIGVMYVGNLHPLWLMHEM
jgi:hypothetical protein